MTAQIPETLIFQGGEHAMFTNPLDSYFELGGANPGFMANCSALWRGYVGRWEILEGRLYLVGLGGELEDGSEASLASVFPDHPERVFAHWFTGQTRLPQGKQLEYVHMGYGSTYERDLFLNFDRGVLVETHARDNGEASPDAPKGNGVAGMTVFRKP
jgi:hypothetical protein